MEIFHLNSVGQQGHCGGDGADGAFYGSPYAPLPLPEPRSTLALGGVAIIGIIKQRYNICQWSTMGPVWSNCRWEGLVCSRRLKHLNARGLVWVKLEVAVQTAQVNSSVFIEFNRRDIQTC